MRAFPVIPLLLALCRGSNALNVDLNDPQSIKDAAKTIVKDVISIYDTSSTNTPGLFPQPYYWWSSGLTWDTLLDYWALTGDDEYNDLIGKSLLWQIGVDANYMPSNQTKTLGNDDQSTWALACMTAAENNFLFDASSNPYGGNTASSWLEIAQNVFDDQVLRWDTSSCGGGLRWQVFVFNAGYDYKNAASNGNFMELASRLYHYTGNKTYSDWALKVAEWSGTSGLVDAKSQTVYDGLNIPSHCNVNRLAWTADTGRYLAAIPYLSGAVSANLSSPQDPILLLLTTTLTAPTLLPLHLPHRLHPQHSPPLHLLDQHHYQQHLQHPPRNRLHHHRNLQHRPILLPRHPHPRHGLHHRPHKKFHTNRHADQYPPRFCTGRCGAVFRRREWDEVRSRLDEELL